MVKRVPPTPIAATRNSHRTCFGLWKPHAAAIGAGVRQAPLTAILLALLLLPAPQAQAGLGIDAHLTNPTPWVREEVLLTVEVQDDRSIVEQIIAPWTPPGVIVRPLGSRQERVQTSEGLRIRHRHLWAMMPLYPGPLTLQPPSIEARVTGGQRLPLTPPALRLHVRPLDPLLPVDVPVSPLQLTATPLPEAIPRGRPFTWNLTIEGQGLSARGIERWLKEALRDAGPLRAYPPEVTLVERVDPESPLRQRAEVRLSFEPRASGTVPLPELVLPHIDPADGRLRLAHLEGPTISVQHPLWLALRPALPWAGGALLLLALAAWFCPRWRPWRQRRCWLRTLKAANGPCALRRAWHAGASEAMHASVRAELARLDAACYGRQGLDKEAFRALRARLLTLVRRGVV